MNDDRQIDVLIGEADRRRALGDWNGAIDLVRRALSIDPDHARAHAALALALLGARRLHGARREGIAVQVLDLGRDLVQLVAPAVEDGDGEAARDEAVHHEVTGRPGAADHERRRLRHGYSIASSSTSK